MKRVALLGNNSVDYIRQMLHIWNKGDCAVIIDSNTPPVVVAEMIAEAQVSICYTERQYYDRIREKIDKSVPIVPIQNANTSAELLPSETYDMFMDNYSVSEAVVIYSSGTTGRSKGIILSHFAINTNADAIIDYMILCASDRMYTVRNLSHSSTIIGELLVALKTRTPLLVAPTTVPPRCVFGNIERFKTTVIGVNPLLLKMYCSECKRNGHVPSSLKKIYVSGALLDNETYTMAHKIFYNQKIYNAYGCTEAGPRITSQREGCCSGNSAGRAVKGVEIAIIDERGNNLPAGTRGIIHVNTPSRFSGYIKGDTKHDSLYRNWLNTGDIGYIDENGELKIVGRCDDMIIIGAHKIFRTDVEQRIQSIADISECVVTTIDYNDEPILCCLYVSGKEIRSDIKTLLGSVLMRYEIPKIFIKTDALPRTRNLKVSLSEVRNYIYTKIGETKYGL